MEDDILKPSKTTPQYVAMLKNMVLTNRLLDERQLDFDKQTKALETHIKEVKLKADEAASLRASFHQQFFQFENKKMHEYALLMSELDRLEQAQGLTKEQISKKKEYQVIRELGMEGFVSQAFFKRDFIDEFKKKYPDTVRALNKDINKHVNQHTGNKTLAKKIATLDVFEKEFPGLKIDLKKEIAIGGNKPNKQQEAKRIAARSAISMFKAASLYANPSGFLVHKAISGLAQTKAMQPLFNKIKINIDNAVEKTGLKAKFKRFLSNNKSGLVKGVLLGGATLGLGVLTYSGLMESDQAIELMAQTKEAIYDNLSLGFDNLSQAYASQNETIDALLSHGQENLSVDPSNIASPEEVNNALTQEIASPEEINDALTQNTASPEEINQVFEQQNLSSNQSQMEKMLSTNIDELTLDDAEQVVTQQPDIVKVVKYDTLSELIEERLQKAGEHYDYNKINQYIELVAKMNNLDDPNIIKVGQFLNLSVVPGGIKESVTGLTELISNNPSAIPTPIDQNINIIDNHLGNTIGVYHGQAFDDIDTSPEKRPRVKI